MQSRKIIGLEAVRGLASIAVVFHHFMLAFLYEWHSWGPHGLNGTLLGFLFNGEAAVVLFFILSGYVLPGKYFKTGNGYELLAGMLKRIPRLAGPVLISVLLAYGLLQAGLFSCAQLAPLVSNEWLDSCAHSAVLTTGQGASLLDALWQGSFGTFLFGQHHYNTNLWTMETEFYGSLVAYAVAFVLVMRHSAITAPLLFIATLLLGIVQQSPLITNMTCFIAGTYMAYRQSRQPVLLSGKYVPLFVIAPLLCFGFLPGLYARNAGYTHLLDTLLYQLGAILLIWGMVTIPQMQKKLEGRLGLVLGKISFPLYLLHTTLILTLCSRIVLHFTGPLGYASALGLAFAALILTLAPLLWLYVKFDDWWLARINHQTDRLMNRWNWRKTT